MAALASALAGHRLIALDTSVWIYHFEGSAAHGPAADAVLEAVARGRVEAVASELVLLALLVAPLRKGAQDVADEIELTLAHFPHLRLAPVTRGVLVRAAEIRAGYGLRTPDAIMLATAIECGATLAATNDRAWRKFAGIEILLLHELRPWYRARIEKEPSTRCRNKSPPTSSSAAKRRCSAWSSASTR